MALLPEMPLGEHVVEDYASLSLTLKRHPLAFLRREFAREGRIVVLALNAPTAAETAAHLLEIPSLPASEAPTKDYALFAQIDFQHPLFAAFADPRLNDFEVQEAGHAVAASEEQTQGLILDSRSGIGRHTAAFEIGGSLDQKIGRTQENGVDLEDVRSDFQS